MDDDYAAAEKQAWLDERRLEHERNFRRRSLQQIEGVTKVPEPDDAALKREWLRQARKEHEAANRHRERRSLVETDTAPLVDPSLLSTPTEREIYLRQLEETREHSQRERQRMARDADRRPSLTPFQASRDGDSFMRGHMTKFTQRNPFPYCRKGERTNMRMLPWYMCICV